MNILINCSNLKQGGGIQVANSICTLLPKHTEHHFTVVLSSAMENTRKEIESYNNIVVVTYDIKKSIASTFFLRNRTLDKLVEDESIDVVLTVFGPSRWRPSVPHLCGFARAHILPMKTPYFDNLSPTDRLINGIVKALFKRSADNYWTENSAVTDLLEKVFPDKRVYTVSNTYNQIFDDPSKWIEHKLPAFKGITLLTVTNAYPHKNLNLALEILKVLKVQHPEFNLRFVFTIDEKEYRSVPNEYKNCFCFIGKVDIAECPSLYQQADIMFQPTLLECFTATYAEAMRMGVPIVTTDLDFAHGLCGEAACYYSAIDAESSAEAIYKVATDIEYAHSLINNGRHQLLEYDSYEVRAEKLIRLLEEMVQ